MAEIIQGQIELLIQLNQELASQTTPEAAREVRENIKMILELTGLAEVLKRVVMEEDLEERLEALEEAIFGDEDPGEAMERLNGLRSYRSPLAQFIGDCREDLDSIYEHWGSALDRHLGADWCEEVNDEKAGD